MQKKYDYDNVIDYTKSNGEIDSTLTDIQDAIIKLETLVE